MVFRPIGGRQREWRSWRFLAVPKFVNTTNEIPLAIASFVGVAIQNELMDPAIAILNLSMAVDLTNSMVGIDKIDRVSSNVQH